MLAPCNSCVRIMPPPGGGPIYSLLLRACVLHVHGWNNVPGYNGLASSPRCRP